MASHNLIFSQSVIKSDIENSRKVKVDSASSKIYKMQAGEIKSIEVKNDSTWIIAIKLYRRNPLFQPGIDSLPFFIDENRELRNLTVTNITKTFVCDGGGVANKLSKSVPYVNQIQHSMDQNRNYFTAYFDIEKSIVNAIYEQCLP